MADPTQSSPPPAPRCIRWWPAALLAGLAVIGVVWVRAQTDWPFQKRNIATAQVIGAWVILSLSWWTFFSGAPRRWRQGGAVAALVLVGLLALLFRVRGVSGDLLPIVEFRWARQGWTELAVAAPGVPTRLPPGHRMAAEQAFPQLYGPDRNGVLPGPRLDTNWVARPPTVVWRQPVGAAWSAFAIAGAICVTQEQRGAEECVVAYELATGRQLWAHANSARYHTTIAGEGPRATPTIVSNRVFTCGATGILNCLDLATGRRLWTRDLVSEHGGKVPTWGFASSPLVVDGCVIVHGGEEAGHLLLAFRQEDGALLWTAGRGNPSYASPTLATLAGVRQVLAFTQRLVSAHDLTTGATLWEYPWQSPNVVCALPVVVDDRHVLFSSGYGRGTDLLEVTREDAGRLSVRRVWKSMHMKSKFAHLFVRDGCVYGLDDGILACVDLQTGALRWKQGRYGHGQGLLLGELYLLMAESGELVLLRPTPEAPNELARFRLFKAKTWNPLAVAGDLLLARNDQEAACVRLALAP